MAGELNPFGDLSEQDILAALQVLQAPEGKIDITSLPAAVQAALPKLQQNDSTAATPAAASPAATVLPIPGFVIKTTEVGGDKVFINVCTSVQIPDLGGWPDSRKADVQHALQAGAGPEQKHDALQFQLSLSAPRQDLDHKGQPCSTIDCIFHPAVIEQAQRHRPLKQYLIDLVISSVNKQGSIQLESAYKLPKMRYKGKRVPHRICMSAPASTLAAAKADGRPYAAPSDPVSQLPGQAHTLPASRIDSPAKASSPTAAVSSIAGPTLRHHLTFEGRPVVAVAITVELPVGAGVHSGITVQLLHDSVCVGCQGCKTLQVHLPFAVSEEGASATLQPKVCKLFLRLPLQPVRLLVAKMRQKLLPDLEGPSESSFMDPD